MAQAVTFKPSRTFALAAFGLLVLSLVAAGLFGVLGWTLGTEDTPADLAGRLVTALQVVAGAVATVATTGAGSMAARDYASRGLTSSQAHQVLAARSMPSDDPRAAKARGAETDAEDLSGP